MSEQWNQLSDTKQELLVEDMLTIDNEKGFLRRMKEVWHFNDEVAQKLAETELERGYARLSLKAIKNVLPHLERGLRYDEACEAAGYIHSDQSSAAIRDNLSNPPDVRNPVVQKALWETKKVVNALIKAYGKPSVIRVEMARDMKMNKKQREEYQKQQKRLQAENEKARVLFQEHMNGAEPSRDDLIKYRLWLESDKLCVYTGQMISESMLFSEQVDVEHILPYSRCLDASYMNKTLCMAEENRKVKRKQSPFEAYSASPERFAEILVRLKSCRNMPEGKKRKFEQKEIVIDEFIERQLNDTRYICREVKDYLKQLGVPVDVSKGGATADLRYFWGLNRILNRDDRNTKVREDHRHHAIDAMVIALTDRGLFQMLSRLSQSAHGVSLTERGFQLPPPWENFLNDARKSVDVIIVSHASSRKISGALHEETAYGLAGKADKDGKAEFVVRKELSAFDKRKQLEDIRDEAVRKLALARLEECGGNFKAAFGNLEWPLLHKDGKTPILSVRVSSKVELDRLVAITDKNGVPYKFFYKGSNHHMEILESRDGKRWQGDCISTYEAARRAKAKIPVIRKDHGSEWRFIMALQENDMVELGENGARRLYRVQKMNDQTLHFRLHTASVLKLENATADDQGAYEKSTHVQTDVNPLRKLKPRKVVVSPLGDIKDADD